MAVVEKKKIKLAIDKEIEYEKLISYLDELCAMSNGDSLDDFGIDEFEEEDKRNYLRLRSRILNEIISIVKKTKRVFDFDSFELVWNGKEFWSEISNQVENATTFYLQLERIRELEEQNRIKLYEEIFHIIYNENENHEYACDKLEIDKNLCILLFRLNNFVENIIYNQRFSERRFIIMLEDSCGLGKIDAEMIWKMFDQDRKDFEKIALYNRLMNIEYKINKMNSCIELIEDDMDYLTDCLFELISNNEGIDGE